MKNYIEDLFQTNMFTGITAQEIPGLLNCVHAKYAEYKKDELIIEEGSLVYDFGFILSGHGRVIKWDASDKVFIITMLKKGSEIGVLLAASRDHRSPVTVQALDDVTVLMISYDRLLAKCEKSCPCHETLLRNYINVVADKGLVLHERIDCLLRPSARQKIITYLKRLSIEQSSKSIIVPFNRNALAQYLNIERSNLSRELSMMKRDGLIDYHMNSFKLL